MSVKVKYKGEQILSLNTDTEKALSTMGQYCEDDITIENVQDGGITPSGSVTLTEENTYDVTDKATAVVDMSAKRASIAEVITSKGVDTLPDSDWDTLETNIGLISSGGGGGTEITIETPLTGTLDVYNFLVSHTPQGATLATATLTNKDPSAFLAYQFLAWAYLTTSRVGGYVRINNGAITANTVISNEYSTRLGVGDKIIINVIY